MAKVALKNAWESLIRIQPEVTEIILTFKSIAMVIFFAAVVLLKYIVNYLYCRARILDFDIRWLYYMPIAIGLITAFSLLIKKFPNHREIFALIVCITISIAYIQFSVEFKTKSNLILMHLPFCTFMFIQILTDTMRRKIFSYSIYIAFQLYVLLLLIFKKDTNDKTYFEILTMYIYYIYNIIISSTCLIFCINLKDVAIKKVLQLENTIKSWMGMMQHLSTGIVIVFQRKIIYKNDITRNVFGSDFNLQFIQIIMEGINDSNYELSGKNFKITVEEVFFDGKIANLYTLHDITSVIKNEEDKFSQRLIATITHELRSPLNVIMSILDILLKKVGSCFYDMIRQAMSATRMQENLINDILDVENISNGKLTLNLTRVDIKEVSKDIVDMMQYRVNHEKIIMELKINDDVPNFLEVDERRFKQILMNLISNSIKFTQFGKIIIFISYLDGVLTCKVSDTGLGIAKEDFPTIFKRFGRAKSNVAVNPSGTGLGLNLCDNLVHAMKGTINFTSEPNILTEFIFSIPLIVINVDKGIELNKPKTGVVKTVMHVDDEPLCIYALKIFAKSCNVNEISFSRPKEALASLEKGIAIDAGFIDLNMGEMDGYELIRLIRQMKIVCPIYAMTGEERQVVLKKVLKQDLLMSLKSLYQ